MGKRNARRKNGTAADSDDDYSSVSSSSTIISDNLSSLGTEEIQVVTDRLLEHALDALYEKRGLIREKALTTIIEAFCSNVQYDFVENKFATLLHQCLNSIKKGSSTEIALASHAMGLLALTVGSGDNASEILKESFAPTCQALRTTGLPSATKLVECLAIITFVDGDDPMKIEQSLGILWQMLHPKQDSNGIATKNSAEVITKTVSSWAFLLSVFGWGCCLKDLLEPTSYLCNLLDKDDRSVRMAAGQAIALIFEKGLLEMMRCKSNGFPIGAEEGLKSKIVSKVRDLSSEASGKGCLYKKNLKDQRKLFKDILEYLEDGSGPQMSLKIGGDSFETSTWSQLIQLNFLKHFLGGGFIKHMQDNKFLHHALNFMPKRTLVPNENSQISAVEKRMYRSPNSVLNKARTQFLNKERALCLDRKAGQFACGDEGSL